MQVTTDRAIALMILEAQNEGILNRESMQHVYDLLEFTNRSFGIAALEGKATLRQKNAGELAGRIMGQIDDLTIIRDNTQGVPQD